jgi:hypothetical protein
MDPGGMPGGRNVGNCCRKCGPGERDGCIAPDADVAIVGAMRDIADDEHEGPVLVSIEVSIEAARVSILVSIANLSLCHSRSCRGSQIP